MRRLAGVSPVGASRCATVTTTVSKVRHRAMTAWPPTTVSVRADNPTKALRRTDWAAAEAQRRGLLHSTPTITEPGYVEVLTPFGPAYSQVRWLAHDQTWYVRVRAPFLQMVGRVAENPSESVAAAWQEIGLAYTALYRRARRRGLSGPAECWAGAARQAFLAAAVSTTA